MCWTQANRHAPVGTCHWTPPYTGRHFTIWGMGNPASGDCGSEPLRGTFWIDAAIFVMSLLSDPLLLLFPQVPSTFTPYRPDGKDSDKLGIP